VATVSSCGNGPYAFVSVDSATASVIQTVPNLNGRVISIDSAGNAYVVNGQEVDIVNTQTGDVSNAVTWPVAIESAVLSPNGQVIYILSESGPAVLAR
jgi:hypothetical protein